MKCKVEMNKLMKTKLEFVLIITGRLNWRRTLKDLCDVNVSLGRPAAISTEVKRLDNSTSIGTYYLYTNRISKRL